MSGFIVVRADVNVCPDCRNTFLQPFVCTTCGAQKLYDETVRSQAATIDRLTKREAELERVVEAAAELAARLPNGDALRYYHAGTELTALRAALKEQT